MATSLGKLTLCQIVWKASDARAKASDRRKRFTVNGNGGVSGRNRTRKSEVSERIDLRETHDPYCVVRRDWCLEEFRQSIVLAGDSGGKIELVLRLEYGFPEWMGNRIWYRSTICSPITRAIASCHQQPISQTWYRADRRLAKGGEGEGKTEDDGK